MSLRYYAFDLEALALARAYATAYFEVEDVAPPVPPSPSGGGVSWIVVPGRVREQPFVEAPTPVRVRIEAVGLARLEPITASLIGRIRWKIIASVRGTLLAVHANGRARLRMRGWAMMPTPTTLAHVAATQRLGGSILPAAPPDDLWAQILVEDEELVNAPMVFR